MVAVVLVLRSVPFARVLAVGAAMLLGGVTWTIGQQALAWTFEPGFPKVEFETGAGFWVLVAGSVVALAGALLVQDWPTPSNGIAHHPTGVQPSTVDQPPG
jgi:hypothetical protein